MSNPASRPTFEVDARLLRGGVVLLCVGGLIWMLGALLSASALGRAAQRWVAQLDESPSEVARRRLHQAKVAAAAGSQAWRDEQSR